MNDGSFEDRVWGNFNTVPNHAVSESAAASNHSSVSNDAVGSDLAIRPNLDPLAQPKGRHEPRALVEDDLLGCSDLLSVGERPARAETLHFDLIAGVVEHGLQRVSIVPIAMP